LGAGRSNQLVLALRFFFEDGLGGVLLADGFYFYLCPCGSDLIPSIHSLYLIDLFLVYHTLRLVLHFEAFKNVAKNQIEI